jgi:GT2 family glycosyltransferase
MKYTVTFVIPVHNRLDDTRECLQSLAEQKDTLFFKSNEIRIIVVDDGSTDGTGEWIKENYPEVLVLRGDGNLWYSGAMNLGMKYAFEEYHSDFIMIWENDTFPKNGYFNSLQKILENWDGKTLICSKLLFRHQPDRIFGMGGIFNRRTGERNLIGRTDLDGPAYKIDMEVDWFLGIGVMIHRDIVADVGYLDGENFPHYSADADYGVRAVDKGYRNVVFHELTLLNDTGTTGISHKKDKSFRDFFKSFTSIKSDRNIRRTIKFYRKHAKGYLFILFLLKVYFIYTASFLKWKVLGWFGIYKGEEKLN